tara:strand:+ start:18672 stop:18935 length:264 start_codon:yes stop_codon:yes gene_type:complete
VTDPDQTAPKLLRATIQDLRAARYCLAGVRPWFQRHGFNWQDFLSHGIDAERLRATGDALVEPVIQVAEMRQARISALAPQEAGDGR